MNYTAIEQELKPCHKCGGKGKIWRYAGGDVSFWIECELCGAATYRSHPESAIENWNNGRVHDDRIETLSVLRFASKNIGMLLRHP